MVVTLRLLRQEQPITLDAIAHNPALVETLTFDDMRPLMAQLLLANGALRSRWFLLSTPVILSPPAPTPVSPDRMLHVHEAARRLGIAVDTLYKNADDYPFTHRLRPRCLRFSEQGIEEYLRSRQKMAH